MVSEIGPIESNNCIYTIYYIRKIRASSARNDKLDSRQVSIDVARGDGAL